MAGEKQVSTTEWIALFGAMLAGILLFAIRIAIEDKRHHVD